MFLIVWKVIFLKKDNQTIINQFSTNCHNIYILTVAYAMSNTCTCKSRGGKCQKMQMWNY